MEEHKTPLEDKKVFRYSAGGIALLVFLNVLFVMLGVLMLGDDEARYRFWGMVSIIFFGGGVVFFLAFKSWKPILIVSKEGIIQPQLRKEKFVSWAEISRIQLKVQTISHRGGTTTVKHIGVFTFEGRQDDTTFESFMTKLNEFATGWREMPTLLINNQEWFSGVKKKEMVEIMEKYHAEFVSELPEEERTKYENIFCYTLTGKLKNTMNFVGDDNSIQEDVNQENGSLENMNAPSKVSDQIDWEKLSTKGR